MDRKRWARAGAAACVVAVVGVALPFHQAAQAASWTPTLADIYDKLDYLQSDIAVVGNNVNLQKTNVDKTLANTTNDLAENRAWRDTYNSVLSNTGVNAGKASNAAASARDEARTWRDTYNSLIEYTDENTRKTSGFAYSTREEARTWRATYNGVIDATKSAATSADANATSGFNAAMTVRDEARTWRAANAALWTKTGTDAQVAAQGISAQQADIDLLKTKVDGLRSQLSQSDTNNAGRFKALSDQVTLVQAAFVAELADTEQAISDAVDANADAIAQVQTSQNADTIALRAAIEALDPGTSTDGSGGLSGATQQSILDGVHDLGTRMGEAVKRLISGQQKCATLPTMVVAQDYTDSYCALDEGGLQRQLDKLREQQERLSDARAAEARAAETNNERRKAETVQAVKDAASGLKSAVEGVTSAVNEAADKVVAAADQAQKKLGETIRAIQDGSTARIESAIDRAISAINEGTRATQANGAGSGSGGSGTGQPQVDATGAGGYSRSATPNLDEWTGTIGGFKTALEGLGSGGGSTCGAGPTIQLRNGVTYQPLSWCGPDLGWSKVKTVVGLGLVMSATWTAATAILAGFGVVIARKEGN